LETVNEKLENGDFICIRAETISARKQRKYNRQPKFWRNILFLFEFVFLRVFPKVWFLKKIYFAVTRGRNRLLSKAEILGRMVCCGFRIVEIESFNGFVHVIAQKENLPFYDLEASYGPIFAMKRIGRGGEIFKVFKLRTMHPYSEYLQDYVLNLNGYAQTGKPDNDFRLTPWGKWFRRLWIDELPQLLNVLRGEMNLVGVRPVTQRYMQDIPEELREKRLKFKPGCIPPYVALGMKGSVNEVLKAEEIYLNERMKKGKWVDVKYFFMALKNIIFKRKRSA
jgi:lipopolysaccharide/colanic/teichoic acid biosynthesis glycosyltransferase